MLTYAIHRIILTIMRTTEQKEKDKLYHKKCFRVVLTYPPQQRREYLIAKELGTKRIKELIKQEIWRKHGNKQREE